MAGMFYSLKEVMGKLKKTEDEVSALVKQGRLREFRDGPNLLFKIDEVESLLSDTTFMAAQNVTEKPQEEEVSLVLEEEDKGKPADAKTDADATEVASEGINVLGETDAEISLTEDTLAQTQAASSGTTSIIDSALSSTKAASDEASLKEIEENVNLDTFGSGSGLLDLSLQADDTSLGGILDEIYTPGEEGKEAAKEASAVELGAEADQFIEKPQEAPAAEMMAEAAVMAAVPEGVAYLEPAADTASDTLGYMLFVPLLATIYTIIVALIGQGNINSPILGIKGLIWPIVGGAAVVSALLIAVAFMGGGTKKPKVKKEKKSKKSKQQEALLVTAEPASGEPVESTVQAPTAKEAADGTTQTTAESADLSGFGAGAEEDIKLDDLDLSDIKDVKEDEDKV